MKIIRIILSLISLLFTYNANASCFMFCDTLHAHRDINVRSGPGTEFPIVGKISAGESVSLDIDDAVGNLGWVEYESGKYVATSVLKKRPYKAPPIPKKAGKIRPHESFYSYQFPEPPDTAIAIHTRHRMAGFWLVNLERTQTDELQAITLSHWFGAPDIPASHSWNKTLIDCESRTYADISESQDYETINIESRKPKQKTDILIGSSKAETFALACDSEVQGYFLADTDQPPTKRVVLDGLPDLKLFRKSRPNEYRKIGKRRLRKVVDLAELTVQRLNTIDACKTNFTLSVDYENSSKKNISLIAVCDEGVVVYDSEQRIKAGFPVWPHDGGSLPRRALFAYKNESLIHSPYKPSSEEFFSARLLCSLAVEKSALYDSKSVSFLGGMFKREYHTVDGIAFFIGDNMEFQNAFGVYVRHNYECAVDIRANQIVKLDVSPGRL